MIFSVSPIELLWIVINLTTFAMTITALFDAKADRHAVRLLNGLARELAADGIVRREFIRLVKQALLLSLVIPALFSDRETPLTWGVIALMTVALLLAIQSFLDARERKLLTAMVAADVLSEKETGFVQLAKQLEETARISQQASDNAEKAYHEANNVNVKIARQGAALVAQGIIQADEREAADTTAAQMKRTVDTTAEQVSDLHKGTAPEKRK